MKRIRRSLEQELAAKALAIITELEEPLSQQTEMNALNSLLYQVEQRLAKYPTTAEDDSKWLAAGAPAEGALLPGGAADLEIVTRRALLAEKRALLGTRAQVRKWLNAVKGGISLRKIYKSAA